MDKRALRERLRKVRREHVASLDDTTRALLFRRPPSPVMAMVPDDAVIGLYHALPTEASAAGYARFLSEKGHVIALPRFADRDAPMEFAAWSDPWGDADLAVGPFGMLQPDAEAALLTPDIVFVPLVGFTASGARLGQGAGHYDRWLARNPAAVPIGMAWDAQRVDLLPLEPHDRPMAAIVTPTRLYGPFSEREA